MATYACPSEEALLAVLLEEASAEDRDHVSGCSGCQDRLRRVGSELNTLRQAALQRTRPFVARPEAVPASIGRYLVVGTLGSGGQGRVYRGRHPRLGIEVAIKWSDVGLAANASGRDALVAEGQILAQLNHPHLLRVLDLDIHEQRPFLVMEYVRGGNLEERRRKRPIRPEQAAAWVAQLADALQEAHAAGITHQDVKPGNVLVDEADRVRLADFGLARLRRALAVDDEPLGGTLAYMAPEQARKEVARIGPASDVFGLGGVLFFLLTGRAVFEGEHPLEVRHKACEGAVDFAALEAARVPRPLAAICRRALAADPAERYATAGAMAMDLKRWLNRSRMPVFLAAALAVLVVVAAGFFVFRPHVSPLPTDPQPLIEQVTPEGRGVMGDLFTVGRLHEGDHFKLRCDVPRGYPAALFAVDSEGKVSRETGFEIEPGEPFDRLVFPGGKATLRQRGRHGTEMFLVCASRSSLRADEIEALLRTEGTWPGIKGNAVLSLRPDKVEVRIVGPRGHDVDPKGTDVSEVEDKLDKLRLKLREQCDFFVGVVYGYGDDR